MNKKQILIIGENVPHTRKIYNSLSENYRPMLVENEAEALEEIQNHSPDLLLLGATLLEKDGYEVCRFLRRKWDKKNLPILILHREYSEEEIRKTFECGANDYILPPFFPLELQIKIQNQIDLRERTDCQKREKDRHLLMSILDREQAILSLDKNQQIERLNDKAEKLLGYPSPSILGKEISILFPNLRERLENIHAGLETENPLLWESIGKGKNGSVMPLRIFVGKLKEEDKVFFLLIPDQKLDSRHSLVYLMNLSLRYWDFVTGKNKISLAGESGLWKVHCDGEGHSQVKTLNRYLSYESLPHRPNWKNVLDTVNFVLDENNCPPGDRVSLTLKKELEKERMWFFSLQRKNKE